MAESSRLEKIKQLAAEAREIEAQKVERAGLEAEGRKTDLERERGEVGVQLEAAQSELTSAESAVQEAQGIDLAGLDVETVAAIGAELEGLQADITVARSRLEELSARKVALDVELGGSVTTETAAPDQASASLAVDMPSVAEPPPAIELSPDQQKLQAQETSLTEAKALRDALLDELRKQFGDQEGSDRLGIRLTQAVEPLLQDMKERKAYRDYLAMEAVLNRFEANTDSLVVYAPRLDAEMLAGVRNELTDDQNRALDTQLRVIGMSVRERLQGDPNRVRGKLDRWDQNGLDFVESQGT